MASYASHLQKTLNDANLLFIGYLSEMRWSTTSTVVVIGFSRSPFGEQKRKFLPITLSSFIVLGIKRLFIAFWGKICLIWGK